MKNKIAKQTVYRYVCDNPACKKTEETTRRDMPVDWEMCVFHYGSDNSYLHLHFCSGSCRIAWENHSKPRVYQNAYPNAYAVTYRENHFDHTETVTADSFTGKLKLYGPIRQVVKVVPIFDAEGESH